MEQELDIIRAAQKNPAAFRPLYDAYYEPIFRFLIKRTADEALAADLTSQVFLKAMRNISRYEYRGVPFSAWLFRIASNELAYHYRQTQKNRVVSIQDYHVSNLVTDEYAEDFEEKKKIMLDLLSDLKEKDLLLVELRFFEQRSFKEIADILGMTESNAKVKTYRIIERMKKKVNR